MAQKTIKGSLLNQGSMLLSCAVAILGLTLVGFTRRWENETVTCYVLPKSWKLHKRAVSCSCQGGSQPTSSQWSAESSSTGNSWARCLLGPFLGCIPILLLNCVWLESPRTCSCMVKKRDTSSVQNSLKGRHGHMAGCWPKCAH